MTLFYTENRFSILSIFPLNRMCQYLICYQNNVELLKEKTVAANQAHHHFMRLLMTFKNMRLLFILEKHILKYLGVKSTWNLKSVSNECWGKEWEIRRNHIGHEIIIIETRKWVYGGMSYFSLYFYTFMFQILSNETFVNFILPTNKQLQSIEHLTWIFSLDVDNFVS